MVTYCVTGRQVFTTNPTSEEKSFEIDFEAKDDDAARAHWKTLRPSGARWEKVITVASESEA